MNPSHCICSRFPYPHERQRLCGIGFNEFLGEVQARLLKAGYKPPAWPEPKIRDQGDLDAALDSCVQWCADALDREMQMELRHRTELEAVRARRQEIDRELAAARASRNDTVERK